MIVFYFTREGLLILRGRLKMYFVKRGLSGKDTEVFKRG
jgi:hypothetical protein